MKNAIANLDTSYPAVPASVAYVRAAVASLAALAGASEEALNRARLAVSEAVSNAVVHAYEEEATGAVHVAAAAIDGELAIVVADDGCGLGEAAESPGLGFGMTLMALVCDTLTFTKRSSGGTQVELRLRLGSFPCREQAGMEASDGKSRAATSDKVLGTQPSTGGSWEMSTLRRN